MRLIKFMKCLCLSLTLCLRPTPLLGQEPKSQPLSFEEWSKKSTFNNNGRLKDDSITKLPEISTLFGIGRGGKIKPAIGIELFHNRNKPRKHKWKLELQVAEDELALGLSRILVPVVNFTVGPYFGFDFEEEEKTYGVRFGIFKF